MIYVLIVLWSYPYSGNSGKAAVAVEFNDIKSCQAAAAEIRKQTKDDDNIGVMVCAAKGAK